MKYETNRQVDLTAPVALYPTSLAAAGAPEVRQERPWGVAEGLSVEGTKKRVELVQQLLRQVAGLLDVLQPAHREGSLDGDDIRELQRLELWYSHLQADLEHIRISTAAAADPAATTT